MDDGGQHAGSLLVTLRLEGRTDIVAVAYDVLVLNKSDICNSIDRTQLLSGMLSINLLLGKFFIFTATKVTES